MNCHSAKPFRKRLRYREQDLEMCSQISSIVEDCRPKLDRKIVLFVSETFPVLLSKQCWQEHVLHLILEIFDVFQASDRGSSLSFWFKTRRISRSMASHYSTLILHRHREPLWESTVWYWKSSVSSSAFSRSRCQSQHNIVVSELV